MELETFRLFSGIHIAALILCLLVSIGIAVAGCRWRSPHPFARLIRVVVVAGCVLFWILNTGLWLLPANFRWEAALPLQFCNLANLIGAIAVGRQIRVAQSLLYFWSFGLCIWAFLTPSLDAGPASAGFWIFWGYHLFILVPVLFSLSVDRFRPTWRDYFSAVGITFGYTMFLAILDSLTGWNYGFVGVGSPLQPSPVDVLGPYPLRIVWMILIGGAVFAVLMLPWLKCKTDSLPEG